MSASREKKNRQDLSSQGIQDPKAIREAEEKAQQRKANRLYGAIAVVFVLVAALLVVVNSGVLERSATAITVDGENYTAAQMNYYYYGIKNSIINSGYSSFYGIDTSVAMDKQNMSDTAKMLLQVTDEGDITWDQFFRDYATRQLSVQVMAAKEAEANGMGEDDDIRAEVNEVIDNITAGAKEQGYTLKSYLKLAYGSTMTVSTFKKMMTLEEVATHYMQHYQEELSYTESQLEEYYQANSSDFDVASYEYIYFKGTADSTTDADGNTVQPTEAAYTEDAKRFNYGLVHGSKTTYGSLIVGWKEGADPTVVVVPTVPDLSGCGDPEICPRSAVKKAYQNKYPTDAFIIYPDRKGYIGINAYDWLEDEKLYVYVSQDDELAAFTDFFMNTFATK